MSFSSVDDGKCHGKISLSTASFGALTTLCLRILKLRTHHKHTTNIFDPQKQSHKGQIFISVGLFTGFCQGFKLWTSPQSIKLLWLCWWDFSKLTAFQCKEAACARSMHCLLFFIQSTTACFCLFFMQQAARKKNAKCETKVPEKKWSEGPQLTLSPFFLAAKRVNHQAAPEFKPTSLPHSSYISVL